MKTRCPLRNAESVRQIPWDDDGGWHVAKLKGECADLIATFKANPNFSDPVAGLTFGVDLLEDSICEIKERLDTTKSYLGFLQRKCKHLESDLSQMVQFANNSNSSDMPPFVYAHGDSAMVIEEGTGTRLEALGNTLFELEDGSLIERIKETLDTLVLVGLRHSALRQTKDYPTGGMKRAAVESRSGAKKEGWEFVREEYARNPNRTSREVYGATVARFAKTHPMIKFPLLWDTVRSHFKDEVKLKVKCKSSP